MFIDTTKKLESLCQKITDSSGLLAIDTEFMRSRGTNVTLCLIQVGFFYRDKKITAAIDPMAEGMDMKSFAEVLFDNKIKKIFHSSEQDIEVLLQITKKRFFNVEDTQIMDAFLSYGNPVSYKKLVNDICGVELAKEETRSDWTQRPLTKEQIRYALDDVEHLIEIYQYLDDQLKAKDRRKFYAEAKNEMIANYFNLREKQAKQKAIKPKIPISEDDKMVADYLYLAAKILAKEKSVSRNIIFTTDDAKHIVLAGRIKNTITNWKYAIIGKELEEMMNGKKKIFAKKGVVSIKKNGLFSS